MSWTSGSPEDAHHMMIALAELFKPHQVTIRTTPEQDKAVIDLVRDSAENGHTLKQTADRLVSHLKENKMVIGEIPEHLTEGIDRAFERATEKTRHIRKERGR